MRKVHALYLTVITLLVAFNIYQYFRLDVQKTKYNTGIASLTIKLEEPKYGDLVVKEGMTVVLRKAQELKSNGKIMFVGSYDDARIDTLDKNSRVTFNNLSRNTEWFIDLVEGTTTVHLTSYRVEKELDDELLIYGAAYQTKVTTVK